MDSYIIFYGNRVSDIRIQDDKINTLQARMGTGGNNMPLVATTIRFRGGKPGGGKGPLLAEGISQVLTTPNDQILFTIKEDDMKAYDEYNDSISDVHHTLRAGTKQSTGVMVESNVRRLTPIECERLQGFPDNWTEGQADTHRYKQMGNAVAVPVVEWIIQNICDTV